MPETGSRREFALHQPRWWPSVRGPKLHEECRGQQQLLQGPRRREEMYCGWLYHRCPPRPPNCAKSTVVGSLGGLVEEVSELTLAAEDGKGSMNIWRVDKTEEEIVLNSLGDGFVLLDIPPQDFFLLLNAFHHPYFFSGGSGLSHDSPEDGLPRQGGNLRDYIVKDPQGDLVKIRAEDDDTCSFDYGSEKGTLRFSIEFGEYSAAANLYDGGRNLFEISEDPRDGRSCIYYHTPSSIQSASVPKNEFEAVFKSVNPFHHLKEIVLLYMKPTLRCKELFDAVVSTPPAEYQKGAQGFLQFLRDTHSKRNRLITEWNKTHMKRIISNLTRAM
ncbi:hypothetical protein FOZ60_005048 [Perkinsus olseni]|uniref:Uncharacterized protein n=1 Tax=Perkinsus olseni TaxID=32597 RepID=A0A7J6NU65_PEROL|nr:hypothetical protein FOZ60_005048 [Perkinsus olseni]